MIKKNICCSFDAQGVVMTINNGVHPDRPGHYSKTVLVSRADWNEAVQNRQAFSKILGVDITAGWQNTLGEAINAAKRLNIDIEATAKFIADCDIANKGEEAVKADAEKFDEANEKVVKTIKEKIEETKDEKDGSKATRKGNRKTGTKKSSEQPASEVVAEPVKETKQDNM